ncbi:enolase C-terminal domain-like protein [Lipomyces kononenkoae]|uniref:Enolase C-terminal domain-like protein n=1 Tax=Lipomyces kononenkoae TaxID=34357 RepID=A0ACC3SSI0_LIPKO
MIQRSCYRKGLSAISATTSDKIKSIETSRVPPRWLFVKVETETGIVGWGEATLEGHTEAVEGAFEDFKERFIGWEAANIEDIYQSVYQVLMSALAGLDIALVVWQLLGGKVRDRVAVYGWIGGDRPKDVLRQAQDRKDQGFTAVKMNAVQCLGWLASPDDLKATVERIKDVRSISIDVGIDFHGRLQTAMAKQLVRMLEPYHPLLPGHINELSKLYQQTTIPIALGERLYTRQMVRPYLEAGCIDIIQPDISHSGGISETKRIATLAETYDVGVAAHLVLSAISFAASLPIAISSPNFLICEMSWKMHYNLGSDYDLFSYVKDKDVFKATNGFVEALSGPGLGIEIDEDLVRKAAAETKDFAWRNPVWRGPDGGIREW